MAKVGSNVLKPDGKNRSIRKKTRQGKGLFTKWYSNKRSKHYKKKYRGQGR